MLFTLTNLDNSISPASSKLSYGTLTACIAINGGKNLSHADLDVGRKLSNVELDKHTDRYPHADEYSIVAVENNQSAPIINWFGQVFGF